MPGPLLHKNFEYRQDIVEVAPGDRFVDCDFYGCEFVGCGPASFQRCHFSDCDFRIQKERVNFEHCTRK
jgi:hypothetical protein